MPLIDPLLAILAAIRRELAGLTKQALSRFRYDRFYHILC
jgi:hypothetical protein